MNSRIHFISFADSKMFKTLLRIKQEAETSGFFNKVDIYTEQDFDPSFTERFGDFIRQNRRGYGYWIWKSYLINRKLSQLNDGDVLVYCDGGCTVNKYGKQRFHDYLQYVKESMLGIVCFTCGEPDGKYCKGDILDFYSCRSNVDIIKTQQIMSTLQIIRVCQNSRSFYHNMSVDIQNNLNLLDDSPSKSPNLPEFVENRHDQSFFSLLLKKNGEAKVLSGSEVDVWPPSPTNWRRMRKQPFLAMRNRASKDYSSIFEPYSFYGIYLDVMIFFEKVRSRCRRFF